MPDKSVAIYIRLSRADSGTGHGKDESDSVVNQRSLIHRFLDGHPELSDWPRAEFVDDGFSGTNTDRPAFQRMVAEIRAGRHGCCITKDFSRFARDYIELGDYMECVFPFLGVRYISINDGYDSENFRGTTGGLDAVMRAIVYDAYSKDLSLKVKTGKEQGRKKGRRVCGAPCYGYRPDPKRPAMDVIDPEAAAVVRRIFEAVIGGTGIGEVAAMLNREHIPTPGAYFRQKNPGTKKFANTSEKQRWNYSMVYIILKRYAYTGAAVGGMREQTAPCCSSTTKRDAKDWTVVPGMHEAIVTPEEYGLAQWTIADRPRLRRKPPDYPLKSLVVCGNCMRRMTRQKGTARFYCKHSYYDGEEGCKGIRSPREAMMEQEIYRAIQSRKKSLEAKKEQPRKAASGWTRMRKLKSRLASLKRKKFWEYDLYARGKSSMETYLQRKRKMDEQISRTEADIQAEQERQLPAANDGDKGAPHEEKALTYEMAHAFVDKILVYPDERIEIKWKSHDCISASDVR